MASITQSQLQEIFGKADASGQTLDRGQIVQELVNRGNTIEGLNEPLKKKEGFFSGLAADATKRMEHVGEGLTSLAKGEQGVARTLGNFAGAQAGFAGDVIGKVIGSTANALTPQSTKDALKRDALKIINTPIGQAGLSALQGGMEVYSDWKEDHPRDAATLEDVVNIANFLPVGAGVKIAAQPVARGFVGVSRALGTALEPVEMGLRESAERGVKQVLGATTKQAKMQSERLAPEILSRPMSETLAITRKGMQNKAAVRLEKAGQAMDNFGALEGTTKLKTVIDALEAEKGQFVVDGVSVNPQAVDNITKMQDLLAQYGDEMPTESLRNVRKLLDDAVYGAKGSFPTVQEGSKLSAQKLAADRIRGILAEAHPEMAKLNKEYTFWKNLEGVLSATNLRQGSQSKGLVKNLATLAGAASAAEPSTMAARALLFRAVSSVVGSPTWKIVSAKAKSKLADTIAASRFLDAAKTLEESVPQVKMIREAIEDITKNADTGLINQNRSIQQTPDIGGIGQQMNSELPLPDTLPPPSPNVNSLVDDAMESPKGLPRNGATTGENRFDIVGNPYKEPDSFSKIFSENIDREKALDLSKKFPNLTPEEIANLTPEERATGIIGGSDGVDYTKVDYKKGSTMDVVLNDPEYKARWDKINAAKKASNAKVTKTSNNLYHTTSSENLASIKEKGLTTGNKARFEGVSSPNKISFSANEAGANYYGKQGDVMIRTKRGYAPDDLDLDLLAGGEGTYITGKNIPPEMLEVKIKGKWVPLKESPLPKSPLAVEARKYKSQYDFVGALRRMKSSETPQPIIDALKELKGKGNITDTLESIWKEATGYIEPVRGKPTPIPGTNLNVEDLPF